MKCPFRLEAEFEYIKVEDSEGNPDYLQKTQRTEFADCYEDACPYYIWGNGCSRIGGTE